VPSLLYLMLLYWWNEAEDCRQRRHFSLSSTVPLAILGLTAVWLMSILCIQAPLINGMHSQSAGSNVRTIVLILIATATHTASAGGRNGANECDCNTEFPYFKCQNLLNVMALACACECVCVCGVRACICVRACVISLLAILNIWPIRFCTA
jgi:hypothetical protein